jgi:hypothetical protein
MILKEYLAKLNKLAQDNPHLLDKNVIACDQNYIECVWSEPEEGYYDGDVFAIGKEQANNDPCWDTEDWETVVLLY